MDSKKDKEVKCLENKTELTTEKQEDQERSRDDMIRKMIKDNFEEYEEIFKELIKYE